MLLFVGDVYAAAAATNDSCAAEFILPAAPCTVPFIVPVNTFAVRQYLERGLFEGKRKTRDYTR